MVLKNEIIYIEGSLTLQFTNGSKIVFSESGMAPNIDLQSSDQITSGFGDGLHLDNLTVAVQGDGSNLTVNGVAVPTPAV